jgi:aryl-alcohol dehydrogenase-like predicted oxidoreductase
VAIYGRHFTLSGDNLVLAWLLARGPNVVPIPGTKRQERLDDNLGALQVRLTAEDMRRISEAIPLGMRRVIAILIWAECTARRVQE